MPKREQLFSIREQRIGTFISLGGNSLMKRFAVTLAVVGMVMLFASYAVGFYAWAPFASYGGGYGSSSSGYYPASSSSSGYWPAASSSSGYTASCVPASSSSSGYTYGCMPASSSSSGYAYCCMPASSSSSGGYYWPAASSSSGYWPASSSSSGWY